MTEAMQAALDARGRTWGAISLEFVRRTVKGWAEARRATVGGSTGTVKRPYVSEDKGPQVRIAGAWTGHMLYGRRA